MLTIIFKLIHIYIYTEKKMLQPWMRGRRRELPERWVDGMRPETYTHFLFICASYTRLSGDSCLLSCSKNLCM